MSWLSKFLGSGVGKVAQMALPAAGPIGIGAASILGAGKALSVAKKVLPGVGVIAGGTVAGELISSKFTAAGGKRRRGRGFSARDVRQTKRFMKILKEVSAAAPKRMSSSRSVVNTCGCK